MMTSTNLESDSFKEPPGYKFWSSYIFYTFSTKAGCSSHTKQCGTSHVRCNQCCNAAVTA
jgi:hypothetical protein